MQTQQGRDTGGWRPARALWSAPGELRPWLVDSGSLTARLVRRSARFAVQVLREGRFVATEDERRGLGLARGRRAWVREVLLLADGVPVVFAHSALHPESLRGPWRMATHMGRRPLGAALFSDPGVRRGALCARRLSPRHPLHRRAAPASTRPLPALWARRSRFTRAGRSLWVTEVFLPTVCALTSAAATGAALRGAK